MPYAIHSAICHHLPSILTMIPLKTLGSHISPRQKLPAALFQRGDEWPGSAMRSMRKSANFRRSSALAMLSLCSRYALLKANTKDGVWTLNSPIFFITSKRSALKILFNKNWVEIGMDPLGKFHEFLHVSSFANVIELDHGKMYRKTLYLMVKIVKTMVSCRFSLKPIQ